MSRLLAGDKTALISAFDVGVVVCSTLGFFVGSSASMTPKISLLMIAVAESASLGGFGPRAVRRVAFKRFRSRTCQTRHRWPPDTLRSARRWS